jgi:rhodanese-related sulfurtransferase
MKIMSIFCQRAIVVFLFAASLTACSPDGKKTALGLYLTATQAYDLLKKDSKNILFDVRTGAEVKLGMPSLADTNVPIFFQEQKTGKYKFNKDFVTTIEEHIDKNGLNKQSTIIMICKQGYRSAGAVDELAKRGYKKVYSVTDGVDGWRKNNLPWKRGTK